MTVPTLSPAWRRKRLVAGLRVGFAVLVVAAAVYAVASHWSEVRQQLAQLHVGVVVLSGLAAVAGVVASMFCWRAALADLGSSLPVPAASRVFFLGQLGKYLPGSVWQVVAQMELAREHDVPRRRSASAYVVMVVVYLCAAVLLAGVTLPFVLTGAARRYLWLLVLLPVLLFVLHPPVLTRLLNAALRLIRREPLEHVLSARGTLSGLAWGLLSWLLLGVHIWLLAGDLGGTGGRLLPLSIGAFALAWALGLVVVIAPAGVGPRDAMLVAVFASALPDGAPAALAVVSRLLLTFADVFTALVTAVCTRSRRRAAVSSPS
jgi:glycosyltransferase 2 family protein